MIIPINSKQAVIRYANVNGIKCIDEHQKVLDKEGYVWFGKIGAKVKKTILSDLLEKKSNYIILKAPKETYFCTFTDFCEEIPKDNCFPDYYKSNFDSLDDFSMWFKITAMIPITNPEILSNIVVISSRNRLSNACLQSMSAHFFTTNLEELSL